MAFIYIAVDESEGHISQWVGVNSPSDKLLGKLLALSTLTISDTFKIITHSGNDPDILLSHAKPHTTNTVYGW